MDFFGFIIAVWFISGQIVSLITQIVISTSNSPTFPLTRTPSGLDVS